MKFNAKKPVFESKNPVFGSKSSGKVRKSLEKFGKVQKQGFPNIWKFRKLFYSKISKKYKKMTLNSNFGNREKTRSDSKTDSKVQLNVRNAGP